MANEEPDYDELVGNKTPQQIEDERVGNMTLVSHLTELRERLIKSLIALAVGSLISYFFIDDIVALITAPAGKLYYMKPAEAFFIYIKIALASGAVIASPVIFYQAWAFFLPALTAREKAILSILVPISVLLFLGGIAFCYFLVLPIGMKFFMGFASDSLQPLLSMESYLDFVLMFLLPFGLIFELPLALVLLAKIGLITSKSLAKSRRYVIFGSFVAAAVLTPPDVFSQVMLALPLMALYEVSFFIVKFILKK
jgi:sec-independent protein translocase protein TatC